MRPLDWAVLLNGALFGAMVALFYWDRFEAHRRSANVREFFVYACVFAILIGWLWWWLRRFPVRWRLLIAGESALLLHFAGGFSIHTWQPACRHSTARVGYRGRPRSS